MIVIRFHPYEENVDPGHDTGLTERAFEQIYGLLGGFGDIEDITQEDDHAQASS